MTELLIVYIQVAPAREIRFGHPFSEKEVFDFDNHSDENMLTYAKELLKKADSLFVFVEVKGEDEKLGIVRPFLSELLPVSKPKAVLIRGSHPMIDRMMGPLGAGYLPDGTSPAESFAKWRNTLQV